METKIKARSFMRGPQGKAFTYADFTPEQLAALKGKDGVSPTISISNITGGYRLTIKDINGTQNIDIMNGTNGESGDGSNGVDGFSPIVEVVPIDGGHRVSITDAEGIKYFDVMNGQDGYTPVKGTDYFTAEDVEKIAEEAAKKVKVPTDTVLYTAQVLTELQKEQARGNIGAVSVAEFNAALGEVETALAGMDEVIG